MYKTTRLSPSVEFMGDITARRSPEELRTIAHIKRFMECVTGDPDFQKALKERPQESVSIAAERGLDIDPGQIHPSWGANGRKEMTDEEIKNLPLAKLWSEWIGDLLKFRDMMRDDGRSSEADPRFNAWRSRQINRNVSEQGGTSDAIVHSILSFELSKGCSVGCWFCGLSAETFQGAYRYTPENARLWRDVLEVCVNKFGLAAQTGFCYWATEPTDNPDYLEFIKDYQAITGALPQTTSAAPLKDPSWTRKLIRLHRELPGVSSRFSITSLKMLRDLHATFTPEELVRNELILQHKESTLTKARSGRIVEREKSGTRVGKAHKITQDTSSIACVSGFLVNMFDRSVRLVSPCRASDRWPHGYRVYAEGVFNSAQEFADFIDHTIERCMPDRVAGNATVAFRDDLDYSRTREGFTVSTNHRTYTLTGGPFVGIMGDLIHRGDLKASDVLEAVIDSGADLFAAAATLQDIFEKGLLNEDPVEGEVNEKSETAIPLASAL